MNAIRYRVQNLHIRQNPKVAIRGVSSVVMLTGHDMCALFACDPGGRGTFTIVYIQGNIRIGCLLPPGHHEGHAWLLL